MVATRGNTEAQTETDHPLEGIGTITVDQADIIEGLAHNLDDPGRTKAAIMVSKDGSSKLIYKKPNHRYPGNELHVMPSAFVNGKGDGWKNRLTWSVDYDYPCELTTKSIFENEYPDHDDWDAFWEETQEMWRREIRAALDTTDEIRFRTRDDRDCIPNVVHVTVEYTGE